MDGTVISAANASSQTPGPRRVARPPNAGTQRGLIRWLPGLQVLREYQLAWLPHDIAAGLVLTTMLVPVGIAYAVASGVPGIYGLYASIVPLLAYALFGPSRILVLGPDSSLAAVILAVIVPLSGGDPQRAVALAGMMAVVAGTVCIVAGVARLGFVTELLSKPIRYGYMNGVAAVVLINQLPKLFGFSIDSEGPLRNLAAFAMGVVRRPDELDHVLRRRRDTCGDHAAQEQQAAAWNPDRRRRRDPRRRRCGSRDARRRRHPRSVAARIAGVCDSVDRLRRHRTHRDRRLRRGARVVCRHQRVVAHLRSAHRHVRRPQPGDRRARRRKSRRRIFPGLPDQQQLRRARLSPRAPAPGPR